MNKSYKSKIMKLRKAGKKYREIVEALGCAPSTVSYYLSKKIKYNALKRTSKNKKQRMVGSPAEQLSYIISSKLNTFNSIGRGYDKKRTSQKISIQDVRNILEKSSACYLTGKEIDFLDSSSWSMDHKIPRCKGGENTLENLGICDSVANKSKTLLTVDEYLVLCKSVLENFGFSVCKN